MSGRPRCASIAPSRSRTSACTIDCGCTTTSMRSNGTSNSQCASITSRPLFMSVAESIVMRAPIVQVGCRSACSGVTSASSAAEQPRNGPPLAVTIRASTALGLLAREQLLQRRVLGVDGQQARAAARERRAHERPARDEALLVGERDVDARPRAPTSVASSPAAPTTALRTTSAPLSAASCATPSGPASTCPRNRARAVLGRARGRPARSCARRAARPRAARRRRRCRRPARRRADRDRRRRPGSPAVRSIRCCREARCPASPGG